MPVHSRGHRYSLNPLCMPHKSHSCRGKYPQALCSQSPGLPIVSPSRQHLIPLDLATFKQQETNNEKLQVSLEKNDTVMTPICQDEEQEARISHRRPLAKLAESPNPGQGGCVSLILFKSY